MVAIKNADADAFAARPDAARPIVLLYGPDAGLVRERAERIIRGSVEDLNDPFALVRLEGDDLASNPSRLPEEAHTVPLFGGKRAIWIKAGGRNFAPAVEMVLATPPVDCRIVIEAGELRKTSPLRTACEKAKAAAAIGCFADNERDLARLIEEEMRAAKLTISPEARASLVILIGGDRQASRSEIRKLALYAHGKERVELEDVLAVVADASALALDAVIDAAFAGQDRRDRDAICQGAGRRHLDRHDRRSDVAACRTASQSAARSRSRRAYRPGALQLRAAGAFQPQGASRVRTIRLDIGAACTGDGCAGCCDARCTPHARAGRRDRPSRAARR